MRKEIKIVAESRSTRGKNEARRLRVTGKIPAVVYGAGKDAAAVTVDPGEINEILYSKTGHNTIFNVEIPDGETSTVMIVDWQHDPVKENLLHIDFERIQLDKKLTVKVPVRTVGEPIGVRVEGGTLEVVHRDITVECLPGDIPEQIEINVEEMSIGDTVRASDLALSDNVTLQGKASMVVCHVVAIKIVEEETAEDEDAIEGEGEGEGAEGSEGSEETEKKEE